MLPPSYRQTHETCMLSKSTVGHLKFHLLCMLHISCQIQPLHCDPVIKAPEGHSLILDNTPQPEPDLAPSNHKDTAVSAPQPPLNLLQGLDSATDSPLPITVVLAPQPPLNLLQPLDGIAIDSPLLMTHVPPLLHSHPHILATPDLMHHGYVVNTHYHLIVCIICMMPIESINLSRHPTVHKLVAMSAAQKMTTCSQYGLQTLFTPPPRPRPPIHPAPTELVSACPYCDYAGTSSTVKKHIRHCEKAADNNLLPALTLPAVRLWPPGTGTWVVVDLEADKPGHTDLLAMHEALPKSPKLARMPHDFRAVSAFIHQTGWASYFKDDQPWTAASDMYDLKHYKGTSLATLCLLFLERAMEEISGASHLIRLWLKHGTHWSVHPDFFA